MFMNLLKCKKNATNGLVGFVYPKNIYNMLGLLQKKNQHKCKLKTALNGICLKWHATLIGNVRKWTCLPVMERFHYQKWNTLGYKRKEKTGIDGAKTGGSWPPCEKDRWALIVI